MTARIITLAQIEHMIADAGPDDALREKVHDDENLEFVAFSCLGKYPNRMACINHSAGKALTLTLGDLITKRGAKIWDEWTQ